MIYKKENPVSIFATIFFLLIHVLIHAQAYTPFPDSNAVWYELILENISYPDTLQYQTKLYGIFDDTLINTQLYKKLYLNDGLIDSTIQVPSPNTFYFCALRQDTALKKVYFVPKDSLNELVLYDFNINVGDTFFVYNEWGAKVKGWCNLKGPILIGGKTRNVICIQTDNIHSFFHTIVEGVGNIRGLFETYYEFSSGKAIKCLTINDSLIYKYDGNPNLGINIVTNFYTGCYNNGFIITEVAASNYKENQISIFPNPFSIKTQISIPEFLFVNNIVIEFFDIQGRLIKTHNKLNSHQLTLKREEFGEAGVYFLRVINGNYLETIKLMIL